MIVNLMKGVNFMSHEETKQTTLTKCNKSKYISTVVHIKSVKQPKSLLVF